MSKMTVLVTEDEPILLDSIAGGLKGDFIVLRAVNGRQAWEVLKRCKVDCLVTDIDMPLMSGLELLEKVRDADYKIKKIVASGGNELLIKERCDELGVNGYLAKPYSVDALIEMINNITKSVK